MNYLLRLLIGASLLMFLSSCSDMGEPEILLPEIDVIPTSLDFSTVSIGSPQTRQITIVNMGEGELNGTLTLVQDSTVYTMQPQGDFVLQSDDTLLVETTFTPQSESIYTGHIQINSDDPENSDIFVNLTGVGTAIPVPALTISSSSLNFGTILSTSSSQQQITLSSTGNDTLKISSISFNLGVYHVDATTPLELLPGSSQILTITFQPDGAGTFNGDMTLISNSPSTPDVVNLAGVAEPAVSYAASVQPIWNSNCSGCHGSNGGLSLSSYANLIAGTSSNGPVVSAGDGANSLIIKRVKGQVGSRMPQGGAALSTATIATIETWINQGALNN